MLNLTTILILAMIQLGFSQRPTICDPQSFAIQLPPTIKLFSKTNRITVTNNQELVCARGASYEWRLFMLGKVKTEVPGVFLSVNTGPRPENFLSLNKADQATPFYENMFEVSVKLIPTQGLESYREASFVVTPEDMSIVIQGGPIRRYLLGTGNLVLDGSASSDLSFWPSQHPITANQIAWTCVPALAGEGPPSTIIWEVPEFNLLESKVHNCTLTVTRTRTPFFPQTKSASQKIRIIRPPKPVITVSCIENCSPADAFQDTVLSWTCRSNCLKDTTKWTFAPTNHLVYDNHLFVLGDDPNTVVFKTGGFKPGDVITFTAWMGEGNASFTNTYQIPPTKIKVNCTSNCDFDPRLDITFKVDCEQDCTYNSYRWEVTPQEINLDQSVSQDNVTLTIPGGTFREGDQVSVVVYSWQNSDSLNFTMNEPSPKLQVTCKGAEENDTCESPDPRDFYQLLVECLENCTLLNYTWTVEPSNSFKWEENVNENRDTLILKGNSFADGDSITFTTGSGKVNTTFKMDFVEKTPKLEIECITNCEEPANPMKESLFQATCTENCKYINFTWTVSGISPKLVQEWYQNLNELLIIPENSLEDEINVNISVKSGKGETSFMQKYVEPVPEIVLSCEENCIDSDPLKKTVLKVKCTEQNDSCLALKYSWEITPLPTNFSWASNVSLSTDNTTISLKGESFQDGDKINFTVKSRKAVKSTVIVYKEPTPRLSMICLENCDPSNPAFLVKFQVNCEANCDNLVYNWTLNPIPDDFDGMKSIVLSNNNATLTIQPDSFKAGNKITLTVKSRKGSANIVASFIDVAPELEIKCEPPCNESLNPLQRVTLSVKCVSSCENIEKFSWTLSPAPRDWNANIVLQKNNESMFIIEDSLGDGSSVTAMVTHGKGNASVELNFVEPTAILSIGCVSNCWEGNPLNDTILEAVCVEECDSSIDYQWVFDPKLDWAYNITTTPQNTTITILAETYKDNDQVEVTLSLRKANTTAKIRFVELAAVLTLNCTLNCSELDPNENVTLAVDCLEHCEKLEYIWDMEPLPPKFSWKKNVVLSKKNKTMNILANSFNDSDVVSVSVTSRKTTEKLALHFSEPLTKFVIICDENCGNNTSNPLLPMSFIVNCSENCQRSNYTWDLRPPPKVSWNSDAKFGPNNETFSLAGGLYRDEGSTRVFLRSSKSETFIDIYFVEPRPQLNISCETCDNPNPFEDLNLTVSCIAECDNISYTWDIDPQPREFSWGKNVKFGPQNESMVIKKETYDNNETALFTVHGRKSEASQEVVFKTPPSYLIVKCGENCVDSDPFKPVKLKVECVYYCNPDPEYKWEIVGGPVTFNQTNLTVSESTEELTIPSDSFEDGQVINVTAQFNDMINATTIKYVETIPEISLSCKKNCDYHPKKSVIIEAECQKNCARLTYNWTLIPESVYAVDPSHPAEKTLEIKGGAYEDNATVVVQLVSRKSEATMNITYFLPEWDGDCVIEPSTGISGTTLFAIECEDFKDGTTYRVYQSYPQAAGNKLGVLLIYGKGKFTESFHLSKADGKSVTVAVGMEWEIKKIIPIKVNVKSFLSGGKRADKLDNIIAKILEFQGHVATEDGFPAVQLGSLLSTALQETNETFQSHYTKHIIAGAIKLASILEPTQSLSLIAKVATETSKHDPLAISLLMEAVQKCSEQMNKEKMNPLYTKENLKEFADDALQLSSVLLDKISQVNDSADDEQLTPDYPFYTDLVPHRADDHRNIRATTSHLFSAVNAVAKAIREPGNTSHAESDAIILSVSDFATNDSFGKLNLTIEGAQSYISIKSPDLKRMLQKMKINFTYQMANFRKNPFWWQEKTNEINTELIQFSVEKITDLIDPISIFLSIKEEPKGEQQNDLNQTFIYEFEVASNSLLIVKFEMKDAPYTATVGACNPNAKIFQDTGFVVNETMVKYHQNDREYVYVGITMLGGNTTKFSFSYTLHECFYWEGNSISWGKDLCVASQETEPGFVHCQCWHFSFFGARAYTPNSTETTMSGESSPQAEVFYDWVILISVTVALLLFFTILLLAHWWDVKLKKKSKVRRLKDNVPGDPEMYLIVVATGLFPGMGTEANVGIQITGTLADSRKHILQGTHGQALQRNSEKVFVLYAPEDLGDLQTLRLWSNSLGRSPHWFCERVIIEHMRTKKKAIFMVERWFSLIYDNAYGVFLVNEKPKLNFTQSLRECMRVTHHVLTLLAQRPRSGTSKETIMVGFASCTTVMLAAMFFLQNFERHDTAFIVLFGFICALATLPVTILLDFLFRYSP